MEAQALVPGQTFKRGDPAMPADFSRDARQAAARRAGMGGTQRLPRLIPNSRALRMMVTGETVMADEALALGIVDRVFPEASFEADVMAEARKLAAGPTMAQGYIKLSVNNGLETSLAQGLAIERAHQNQLFGSDDVQEGLKAFLEKRPAQFTGK